jgi:hypothetical protein
MKRLSPSLLALALIFSQGAFAHTDEVLDKTAAPHGGQLRMAGMHHLELVVKANEITVYLTDHAGKSQPAEGATGTATVLSGKTKTSVPLAPAADNVLKGSGKFELAPGMKVVISVTLPGQAPLQARFTPLQKK